MTYEASLGNIERDLAIDPAPQPLSPDNHPQFSDDELLVPTWESRSPEELETGIPILVDPEASLLGYDSPDEMRRLIVIGGSAGRTALNCFMIYQDRGWFSAEEMQAYIEARGLPLSEFRDAALDLQDQFIGVVEYQLFYRLGNGETTRYLTNQRLTFRPWPDAETIEEAPLPPVDLSRPPSYKAKPVAIKTHEPTEQPVLEPAAPETESDVSEPSHQESSENDELDLEVDDFNDFEVDEFDLDEDTTDFDVTDDEPDDEDSPPEESRRRRSSARIARQAPAESTVRVRTVKKPFPDTSVPISKTPLPTGANGQSRGLPTVHSGIGQAMAEHVSNKKVHTTKREADAAERQAIADALASGFLDEIHESREARSSEEPQEEKVWQDFASCLGVDPDLFFPERGASTREAKKVCQGCIVREICLEYALANGEKFGIWGGMSERERRRIRRQRAKARATASS